MESDHPDLYEVLGVEPTATAEQITHAYRGLLRHHHPDTRPLPAETSADDDRLRQVLAAYAVLRDPARRADYDRARAPRPTPPGTRAWTGSSDDVVVLGTIDSVPAGRWITTVDQAATVPPTHDPLPEWVRAVLAPWY